jgi:hypothetical protein
MQKKAKLYKIHQNGLKLYHCNIDIIKQMEEKIESDSNDEITRPKNQNKRKNKKVKNAGIDKTNENNSIIKDFESLSEKQTEEKSITTTKIKTERIVKKRKKKIKKQ